MSQFRRRKNTATETDTKIALDLLKKKSSENTRSIFFLRLAPENDLIFRFRLQIIILNRRFVFDFGTEKIETFALSYIWDGVYFCLVKS